MTNKQYSVLRIAIVILLSVSISVSISLENYLLPLGAILLAIIILQIMRRRVNSVLADERDYSLAGTAARHAITVFSLIMVAAMFILMYFGKDNKDLYNLSIIFAYLTCALMFINAFIFYFLKLKMKNDKLTSKDTLPYILLGIFIAIIFIFGSLRLFSPEDDWICQNGQWVKHGQPSAPMPSDECKK